MKARIAVAAKTKTAFTVRTTPNAVKRGEGYVAEVPKSTLARWARATAAFDKACAEMQAAWYEGLLQNYCSEEYEP
jgi:hypothetical protein